MIPASSQKTSRTLAGLPRCGEWGGGGRERAFPARSGEQASLTPLSTLSVLWFHQGLENPLIPTEDRDGLRSSAGLLPRHSAPLDSTSAAAAAAAHSLFAPRNSTISSLFTSNLKEYEMTDGDSFSFSCYLWKRSRLYSKMRVSSKVTPTPGATRLLALCPCSCAGASRPGSFDG